MIRCGSGCLPSHTPTDVEFHAAVHPPGLTNEHINAIFIEPMRLFEDGNGPSRLTTVLSEFRFTNAAIQGTMAGGFKRFQRELHRAKNFNAYLYIVVESSLQAIARNNNFGPHKSNLAYVWHNMRMLTHEFRGHCQFIFTGNRTNSELIIPKLLYYGKKLWNVDLQYFIDNNDLDSWRATGEE